MPPEHREASEETFEKDLFAATRFCSQLALAIRDGDWERAEEQPDTVNFEVDRANAIEFLEALGEMPGPPSEIASLVVAFDHRFHDPSALENAKQIADELLAIDEVIPNGAGGEWYSEQFAEVILWILF
jgi:hypothetical protein